MTIVSKASAFPKSVQAGIPRLGRCPEGWTREPLARHLVENLRPVKLSNDAEYDLVTVKRSRGGVVRREHLKGRDISVKSQFLLHEGDFLISKRQIVHGACGLVPAELAGSIVSNEYAILGAKPTIDLNFLNHLAHSAYFQQTCFHSSIGVHVEKMIFKLDRWLAWDFDLPPMKEQQRIAEVLSTWDRAIGTVETLIVNSRAQKQALMQQLLPHGSNYPQRRVGSSYREWQETTLGDLGDTFGGLTGKSKADFGSGFPFVTYKNVFENAIVDPDNCELVKIESGERQHSVKFGDILFTTSSETPEEVGMSSVVMFDAPAVYLNSFCFGFRTHSADAIDPAFSAHYFRSEDMRTKIATLAQGSTRYNISKAGLLKLKFFLPEAAEQREIANILDVAQNEIARLTRQLTALREEKSALMQQLLTGKRRVKINEKEDA